MSGDENTELTKKLSQVGLDPSYWLKHFKALGITTVQPLEFLGSVEYDKLVKHKQYEWEATVLAKLLNITKICGVDNTQQTKEKALFDEKYQAATALQKELEELHKKVVPPDDPQAKVVEAKIKELFGISKDMWITKDTDKPWESLLTSLQSEIAGMKTLADNHTTIPDRDVIEQASAGEALRGKLLTKDPQQCFQTRQKVIQCPNVGFMRPVHETTDHVVETTTEAHDDSYEQAIKSAGYKVAISGKVFGFTPSFIGFASFGGGKGHDEASVAEKETHTKSSFYKKTMYVYMPMAACEFNLSNLKLSASALNELKQIDTLIALDSDTSEVQRSCRKILDKYGSHINTNILHFGGIFKYHAKYTDKSSSHTEVVKKSVSDSLNGFVSAGGITTSFAAGGTVSGERTSKDASIEGTNHSELSSEIELRTSKMGGPPEVNNISLWKMGLASANDTWNLIDRGLCEHFTGIWKLFVNHKDDLPNWQLLQRELETTWNQLSGTSAERRDAADDTTDALEQINSEVNNILDSIKDKSDLNTECAEYLTRLHQTVVRARGVAQGRDVWRHALQTNKSISELFVQIVELEGLEAVPIVKDIAKSLFEPVRSYEFPHKQQITNWIFLEIKEHETSSETFIPLSQAIKSVSDLVSTLVDIVTPRLRKGTAPKSLTGEMASTVNSLFKILSDQTNDAILLEVVLIQYGYTGQTGRFARFLNAQEIMDIAKALEAGVQTITQLKSDQMKISAYLLLLLVINGNSPPHVDVEGLLITLSTTLNLNDQIARIIDECTIEKSLSWEQLKIRLKLLYEGTESERESHCLSIPGLATIAQENDQMPKAQANSGDTEVVPEPTFKQALVDLGLTKYFPQKITLQDVMQIKPKYSKELEHVDLPWKMLNGLIILDHSARDALVAELYQRTQKADDSDSDSDSSSSDGEDCPDITMYSPLDIFNVTFQCCSPMLRQALFSKMFTCKLAVPIFQKSADEKCIEANMWPLRSTIIDWGEQQMEPDENNDPKTRLREDLCLNIACDVVSVIRLGRPNLSKSDLLNNLLFKPCHETFHSFNCPAGKIHRMLGGFVEGSWYIPGVKNNIFQNVTMFLNLRGDGVEHKQMVDVAVKASTAVVVVINIEDLEDTTIKQQLLDLHQTCENVVLLYTTNNTQLDSKAKKQLLTIYRNMLKPKKTKKIDGINANDQDLKDGMTKELSSIFSNLKTKGQELEQVMLNLHAQGVVVVDELHDKFQHAKVLAEKVLTDIQQLPPDESKNKACPTQGKLWKDYSKFMKEEIRRKNDTDESELRRRKVKQRQAQLDILVKSFPDVMHNFIKPLIFYENENEILDYFIAWLKMMLDSRNRQILPDLTREYNQAWQKHRNAKDDTDNKSEAELNTLVENLARLEKKKENSVVGLEHLFREIGQIYEAVNSVQKQLGSQTQFVIKRLPYTIAKLIRRGHTFEIMDGNASNIPMTFLKDVLQALSEIAHNKKVVVISVIGVQSSGKSTMLNTMFGMQFAVSAGRCTKGVFAQIIPVQPQVGRWNPGFDYVMVVDTEGLGSPELGMTTKHDHDNELATLALGIGDITIINIKGENAEQIKDVLQIAMHAFLRMKMADSNYKGKQRCVFIYNSSSSLSAEKTLEGQQALEKQLDLMIALAAEQESNCNIRSFRQVLDINLQKHMWHFDNLWYGTPPMATVNLEYSQNVKTAQECIMFEIAAYMGSHLAISDIKDRIDDLWKAILAEDFVFSFQNTIELKAYKDIERQFLDIIWSAENQLIQWVDETACIAITQCETANQLDECSASLYQRLESKIIEVKATCRSGLLKVFEDSEYSEIVNRFKQMTLNDANVQLVNQHTKSRNEIEINQENRRADILKHSDESTMQDAILKQAKALAKEYQGKEVSEEQLHKLFNQMWDTWVQLEFPTIKSGGIDIHTIIRDTLRKLLSDQSRSLDSELEKRPLLELPPTMCRFKTMENMVTEQNITASHLQPKANWLTRKVKNAVGLGHVKDTTKTRITRAVYLVNDMLHALDKTLRNQCKKGKQFRDHNVHVLLNEFVSSVDAFNKDDNATYTMVPQLKVHLAVQIAHVAHEAYVIQQAEYEKTHGATAFLAEFKIACQHRFLNEVDNSSNEIIAADYVCDALKTPLLKAIQSAITKRIVGALRADVVSKRDLICMMCDGLAEFENFTDFTRYITDSASYAREWLRQRIEKQWLTSSEKAEPEYARQGVDILEFKLSQIRLHVKHATDGHPNGTTLQSWVDQFCPEIQNEVKVPKEKFVHVTKMTISDSENFQNLIIKKLANIKQVLTKQLLDMKNVEWGEAPEDRIMDHLWGCEAQCPFCNEPCANSIKSHSTDSTHKCIQHRPLGVAGAYGVETKKLSTNSCNYLVSSNSNWAFVCSSKCCGSSADEKVSHPYTDYKKYFPKWDIDPASESDKNMFWCWFMKTFNKQLAERHNSIIADIPSHWQFIDKKMARDSLRKSDTN